MGARQSKRVEISSVPKKGDVENGAVVGTEEKLEKIEEGETVASSKSNANGSTTTSSTVTAEQQETAASNIEVAAVPDVTSSNELESKSETMTEVAATEKLPSGEVISPSATDDSKEEARSPASPSEATTTEEGASTTEKKKKPKKRWSFRSFSFSKKDKQKPVASKDEQKQQETLPEGNEAVSQTEQQNNEEAEKKKKEQEGKKKDDQIPPPLPTSPPPTPAEEIAVVATSIANVEVAAVPEKEESPNASDGDIEISGAGEALAEPLEDGELPEESITETITVTNGTASLTNGTNGEIESNGKVSENGDLTSPVGELKTTVVAAVDSVTAKIDSLKLHIASDNSEAPAQNGFGDHALNGEMNGTDVNGDAECEITSDSVVSVDVSPDVSADI